MTSETLYSWLSSFINLERGLGGAPSSPAEEHFKLDRMMILANLAGHPELSVPVIHVAGSKGKGSVTAMISSILEKAGIKTARYMSPHVSDWRERISRGDGSFFPKTVYEKAGEELQKIYSLYKESQTILQKQTQTAVHPTGGYRPADEPTFFELMTLLFFLCAGLENCKAMVVETGLGGRLDATNIVDPLVSVITVIEKEHTEYLGDTLTEIASEKAGIIKKNRPVVSAEQKTEVLAVLQQKAKELNAPFMYITESMHVPNMQLKGAVYAFNAALAAQTVRLAFSGIINTNIIEEICIIKGLEDVTLPARFETIIATPPFVIDGAHTPLSVTLCAEIFCELYGNSGILLFGCAADKDSASMAEILLLRFSYCIITATGNFRTSEPVSVYETFCDAAKKHLTVQNNSELLPQLYCIPDTKTAIEEAVKLSKEKNLPILGCGSFYLAAEIRKHCVCPFS